jgi:murein DD-endopeptidase MepM/ murein hydrolase activator NlpD
MPLEGTAELWCTQSNGGYAGCAGHHDEPAMDIGVPVGTPIIAAGPGVVTAADIGGGRGNYVDLDHPDGSSSHYLHLSELSVSPGQIVGRGERLGLSGSTGSSSAPHLHYEERGPTGRPAPIGPMYGRVGTRTVSYPVGQFGLDWRDVDYGTLLTNDGFRPDVGGDLDGDGRPDRAAGRLTATGLGVSLSTEG